MKDTIETFDHDGETNVVDLDNVNGGLQFLIRASHDPEAGAFYAKALNGTVDVCGLPAEGVFFNDRDAAIRWACDKLSEEGTVTK